MKDFLAARPPWPVIRLAILVGCAILVAAQGPHPFGRNASPTLVDWIMIPVFFVVGAVMVVVGVRFLGIPKPGSKKLWRISPFSPWREPLAFFHFGGFFFVAAAVGMIVGSLTARVLPDSFSWMVMAFGLGILSGIGWEAQTSGQIA